MGNIRERYSQIKHLFHNTSLEYGIRRLPETTSLMQNHLVLNEAIKQGITNIEIIRGEIVSTTKEDLALPIKHRTELKNLADQALREELVDVFKTTCQKYPKLMADAGFNIGENTERLPKMLANAELIPAGTKPKKYLGKEITKLNEDYYLKNNSGFYSLIFHPSN